MEYAIVAICKMNSAFTEPVTFYISYDEDDCINPVDTHLGLQNATIFDEFSDEEDFSNFITKIYPQVEKYVNSFNLTVDRFELLRINFEEVAIKVI